LLRGRVPALPTTKDFTNMFLSVGSLARNTTVSI
jgi:hypothetical protein